jgi:hypothetical protein
VKSQKILSTFAVPMTEYNPLEVCPVAFKFAQDVGIPKYVGLGLTSAYPITLWNPEETSTYHQAIGFKLNPFAMYHTCIARQFGEIAVNIFY